MAAGLSFEEAIGLAQDFYVECQKKATSKYAEPIAEKIIKMQADYAQTKAEMKKKIALMEHDKELTGDQLGGLMDKFNNFSDQFTQRRTTQAHEGHVGGDAEMPPKLRTDLSRTYTTMQKNYEQLAEELENEILGEREKEKELDKRYHNFFKSLEFQCMARSVNMKLNLDVPEE